jgi:hypothetical protein
MVSPAGRRGSAERGFADGDYALAITTDGRGLLAILQMSGKTTVRPLGAETAAGDGIELSPLGTYAVLYHHATQSLQVVTGLPGAPGRGQRLDVARHGGPLSAFAINDHGHIAGYCDNDGGTSQTRLRKGWRRAFDLDCAPCRRHGVHKWTGCRGSRRSRSQSLPAALVTGVTATLPLAGEAQELASPQAVAVSRDQRRVYVASRIGGNRRDQFERQRHGALCVSVLAERRAAFQRHGGVPIDEPSEGPSGCSTATWRSRASYSCRRVKQNNEDPAQIRVDGRGAAVGGGCNAQPTITTGSLPSGEATVPYSQTLSADGDKGVLWTIVSGSLQPA